MIHSLSKTNLLIASVLILNGCGSSVVSSDDVATNDAHVNIHVTAGETGDAYINTELLPNGPASNTRIELSQSDQLWASNDKPFSRTLDVNNLFGELSNMTSTTVNLHQGGTFSYGFLGLRIIGDIWYSGLIPESDSNTYYVSLLRDSFQSAMDSSVQLPDVFSVEAPLVTETLSRSNDLEIRWQSDASNHQVSISIFTTCLNDVYDTLDITNLSDTGSYTVAAMDFSPDAVGNCNTNIEVVKTNLGNLDPGFNSGIISGNRVAKTLFISTD